MPDPKCCTRVARAAEFMVDPEIRVPSAEDFFPAGSCQCGGRADAYTDEAFCGLLHEGQMVELRRCIGVGEPREERLDALLGEGVARVIIIVGGRGGARR